MAKIMYGNYDEMASCFTANEAWILRANGTWHKLLNSTMHNHEVVFLTKEDWEKCFPGTPPLPPEAFK